MGHSQRCCTLWVSLIMIFALPYTWSQPTLPFLFGGNEDLGVGGAISGSDSIQLGPLGLSGSLSASKSLQAGETLQAGENFKEEPLLEKPNIILFDKAPPIIPIHQQHPVEQAPEFNQRPLPPQQRPIQRPLPPPPHQVQRPFNPPPPQYQLRGKPPCKRNVDGNVENNGDAAVFEPLNKNKSGHEHGHGHGPEHGPEHGHEHGPGHKDGHRNDPLLTYVVGSVVQKNQTGDQVKTNEPVGDLVKRNQPGDHRSHHQANKNEALVVNQTNNSTVNVQKNQTEDQVKTNETIVDLVKRNHPGDHHQGNKNEPVVVDQTKNSTVNVQKNQTEDQVKTNETVVDLVKRNHPGDHNQANKNEPVVVDQTLNSTVNGTTDRPVSPRLGGMANMFHNVLAGRK